MIRYDSVFFKRDIKFKYLFTLRWWVVLVFVLCVLVISSSNYTNNSFTRNPLLSQGIPGLKEYGFNQLLMSFLLFFALFFIKIGIAYKHQEKQKMVVAFEIDENKSFINLYSKDLLDIINVRRIKISEVEMCFTKCEKDIVLNKKFDCYFLKKSNEVVGRFYINDFLWNDKKVLELFKNMASSNQLK